jgi:hypothetical protein
MCRVHTVRENLNGGYKLHAYVLKVASIRVGTWTTVSLAKQVYVLL